MLSSLRSTNFGLQLLFAASLFASSASASKVPGWLSELVPTRQGGVSGELKCYALPYGGIGFASHILTYYTIITIGVGRNPFFPWRHLKHWKWDLAMSVIGVLVGTIFAIISIVRCRDRWEFLALAVWKALLTITLGGFCGHASLITRRLASNPPTENRDVDASSSTLLSPHSPYPSRNPSPLYPSLPPSTLSSPVYRTPNYTPVSSHPSYTLLPRSSPSSEPLNRKPLAADWAPIRYWLILYIPGLVCGLVGIFALVAESWSIPEDLLTTVPESRLSPNSRHPISKRVRWATYIFLAIVGIFAVMCFFWSLIHYCNRTESGTVDGMEKVMMPVNGVVLAAGGGFIGMGLGAALYSDWVLAALSGNWSGVPSSDHAALYWGYLIAKRFPMLSV